MSKPFIQTGCYVDGTWGKYAPRRVCEIARDLGWSGALPISDDTEDAYYQADVATDWLNENVANDEHTFGWWGGEFFYFSNTEWQEALC